MKRFFIIPIIISLGFVLVSAGEFEEKLIKAEQRNANAQYDIGIMYKTGVGVPQNYKQAYIWFSLAAAQGNKDAAKKRNLIEKKFTPQQLSEAQDLAIIKQKLLSKLNIKPIPDIKPIPEQKSVTGRFIANSVEGTLFIISGKVKNTTSGSISYIKVHGVLITKDKAIAKSQTSFCGNIVPENSLRRSVPFLIVFSDLPADLKNFTVKVSGFERQFKN